MEPISRGTVALALSAMFLLSAIVVYIDKAEGPARVAVDGAAQPSLASPPPVTPQPSPVVTTSPTPEATPEAVAGAKARSTGEASSEGRARVEADVATAPRALFKVGGY